MQWKTFLLGGMLCVCLLNGCSQFQPFVDARREAGQIQPIGSSTDDFPVICHGFVGEQSDIDALAENECAKTNKIAVLDRTESFSCRLFTPTKSIYRCEETQKSVPPHKNSCSVK